MAIYINGARVQLNRTELRKPTIEDERRLEELTASKMEEGSFYQSFVSIWQDVEKYVDQMTMHEFNLPSVTSGTDPRVDLLRQSVGFNKKIDFLKAMGRLSNGDVAKIREFARERNELFHGGAFVEPSGAIPKDKRRSLIELASEVFEIIVNRALRRRDDVKTSGDLVTR